MILTILDLFKDINMKIFIVNQLMFFESDVNPGWSELSVNDTIFMYLDTLYTITPSNFPLTSGSFDEKIYIILQSLPW